MERLEQLSQYFKDKERKKLNEAVSATRNINGLPEMSLQEIKLSCMENNGYETPELNDKLYLHFRGFKKIENLEAYTNCKAIWLDSNGFEHIEGLGHLTELRCLYLSKNLIRRIEGLENLQNLVMIDLSNNRLTKLEGLSQCINLSTLNVSRNALSNAESISHLLDCPSLLNLDITNNTLEAEEAVFDVLVSLPKLVNISINGNEITKIASFRKRMINQMPNLCYLDRPVEELERVAAKAFIEGGAEAERLARDRYREQKAQQRIQEQTEYRRWQKEQAEIRAKERADGRGTVLMEFSPTEMTEREEAANRAAMEERIILDQGIDKLAAKYWQLEGSNKDVDALAAASKAVITEHESKLHETSIESSETSPVSVDDIVVDETVEVSSEELTATDAITSQPLSQEPHQEAITEAESISKQMDSSETKTDSTSSAMSEKQEAAMRQQLVQESLAIYRKQLEDEKRMKEASSNSVVPANDRIGAEQSSLWTQQYAIEAPSKNPLYWSESMDIALAQNTRAYVFDFDQIAKVMGDAASKGTFGLIAQKNPESIDAEACRLRWAQLDAENWCEMDPEAADDNVLYKVCIQPEVLGKGHGAQPSFQALRSMAAGMTPSYLKPPPSFPSVADADSESDDDIATIKGNQFELLD
jgi:dynein assembly factor 1, axonemal